MATQAGGTIGSSGVSSLIVPDGQVQQVPLDEAVELGAIDPIFFCHYFFPKAFRQGSPDFHRVIWDALIDEANRYLGIQVFRGGAKTTLLRTYTARRIAYGITHTAEYIGKSEDHALRSVGWLKRAVEYNERFATAFGLSKGEKWTGTEIEIRHGLEDGPVTVLALGITGSVRGVNVDDWRPDLIVLDDVLDEENSATVEQRTKVNERIFGAVKESLAPASELPIAQMVMLQTPLDRDDASEMVQNDPEWKALRFPCFDKRGESMWPQRWTTSVLNGEKEGARHRRQLSLWYREKECKVMADEKRYFSEEWLNTYTEVPPNGITILVIDPSPPKEEEAEKRKRKEPDPEVITAMRLWNKCIYKLEITYIQDPNPEKTWIEWLRMYWRWKPRTTVVEGTAYQRTLKWYMDQKLSEAKLPHHVHMVDSKVAKTKRIRQAYSTVAPEGNLYIHPSMTTFRERFKDYPDVRFDDDLDCGATGILYLRDLQKMSVDDEGMPTDEEDDGHENWRGAP